MSSEECDIVKHVIPELRPDFSTIYALICMLDNYFTKNNRNTFLFLHLDQKVKIIQKYDIILSFKIDLETIKFSRSS